MTETAGIASSRVVSFTAAAVWMRALMPEENDAGHDQDGQNQKQRHPQRSRARRAAGCGGKAGLLGFRDAFLLA